MTFSDKLNAVWEATGSMVCVGLDPSRERLPSSLRKADKPFLRFNRAIIAATAQHACCFKPQFAHYASENRLDELRETIAAIRELAPGRLVILDAKRGDIGSTAQQYAREAFDVYGADAVTLNPYMGGDTLEPFTVHADRGAIVLCKTSNPGSRELQDLVLQSGRPLYLEVAHRAATVWNTRGNLALVVGATYPEELRAVRKEVGDMPLLIPGIGAQGGDLAATLEAGLRPDGWGVMINSSRGIIHASEGEDFAEAAGRAAARLDESCRIQQARFRNTAP